MTRRAIAACALVAAATVSMAAQDRLKTMPGYDAAQRIARDAPAAVAGAATGVTWIDAGAFEYDQDGRRFRFDVATGRPARIDAGLGGNSGAGRGAGGDPDRGRQFESAMSPNGS